MKKLNLATALCALLLASCGAEPRPYVDPCHPGSPYSKSEFNALVSAPDGLPIIERIYSASEHPDLPPADACRLANDLVAQNAAQRAEIQKRAIAASKQRADDGKFSQADVDRLTTYSVVIGRAVGCGLDTAAAMERIGNWMDREMAPGSKAQQTYLPVFLAGVQQNADAQRTGRSPDSCSSVQGQFSSFPWP